MKNAKVVWWAAAEGGEPKRYVIGKREPVAAWKLFYALRAQDKAVGHIVAGPELWIGSKLVLKAGNTEKGLVLPGVV